MQTCWLSKERLHEKQKMMDWSKEDRDDSVSEPEVFETETAHAEVKQDR